MICSTNARLALATVLADPPRMTEKNDRGVPFLPDGARTGLKDTARLMRHGLRRAGALMFDPPDRPATASPPLRGTVGELARALDRFAGRAEEGFKALLTSGQLGACPPMQPEMLRAVLGGRASEQIVNSFVRHWQRWILFALALEKQRDAVVLERPLRESAKQLPPRDPSQPAAPSAESAIALYLGLAANRPVRMSSLRRGPGASADPRAQADKAITASIVAIVSVAGRKGRASADGAQIIAAALTLMGEEALLSGDASAMARRVEELAALL